MSLLRTIKIGSILLQRKEFYFLIAPKQLSKNQNTIFHNEAHLKAAVDWLLHANALCRGNGFAKIFSLRTGWWGPYIETTGYIIPTLYDFIKKFDYRSDEIKKALLSSGNWLLAHQFEDGAFGDSVSNRPTVTVSKQPMVFDTGQVIFGLLANYQNEKEEKFLAAARKAGDWLSAIQEKDGSWVKFTYAATHRTYYSRVSWSLSELWRITREKKYRDAAERQLRWVIQQQQQNGAFKFCSFEDDANAVLHVIAYTIEGLWRSGMVLKEDQYQEAALKAGKALIEIQKRDDVLYGHYDLDWKFASRSRCLTGLAQMADIWLMMYETTGEKSFLEQAEKALLFLKGKQVLDQKLPNLYGGLLGSYPWWGEYFPWAVPNWGVKFFMDALLREKNIARDSKFL
jgi:hypothetical protein